LKGKKIQVAKWGTPKKIFKKRKRRKARNKTSKNNIKK